jgi:hypothetical protein
MTIEQDIKDYYEMVNMVAKIDIEAAQYLRTVAPNMDNFNYDGCLDLCFIFEDTVQGHRYWQDVSDKLLVDVIASL